MRYDVALVSSLVFYCVELCHAGEADHSADPVVVVE